MSWDIERTYGLKSYTTTGISSALATTTIIPAVSNMKPVIDSIVFSDTALQVCRLSYGATTAASQLGVTLRNTAGIKTLQVVDLDWDDADFGDQINLYLATGSNNTDLSINYYHVRAPIKGKREV